MILISYFLKHNYNVRFENEESSDKEILTDKEESTALPPMQALEGDQAKEGKGLKILTPNKLLTRVPILLTQKKAGNNSYKLKNEIRQILHLLYQSNKVTKNVYNN